MYSIIMPGVVHRFLTMLDVFESDAEAAHAFHGAAHQRWGRGGRRIVTAPRPVVQRILDELNTLVDEIDNGPVSAHALGVYMRDLRPVAAQTMVPRRGAPTDN